jgi:hypothetical protein
MAMVACKGVRRDSSENAFKMKQNWHLIVKLYLIDKYTTKANHSN